MMRFEEEIREQPEVAARLIRESKDQIKEVASAIRSQNPAAFWVAARGTSDHAAIYGKYLFETRNRLATGLAAASTSTLYEHPPDVSRLCTIGISQSGSSGDIVAVLRDARRQGSLTVAITNEEDSDLARAADHCLPMRAGHERSVPASKTYTASLILLALLSQELTPDSAFERSIHDIPVAVAHALEVGSRLHDVAASIKAQRMAVLGRGFHLATTLEVGLKIMETSYVLAEARSVADFLHGPIAVMDAGFHALLIEAKGPSHPGMRQLAQRLRGLGARLITFTDEPDQVLGEVAVPILTGLPEALTPIPYAVVGQLFALNLALSRNLDPDQPRGLAKVTQTR